jgi:hypothetical protein
MSIFACLIAIFGSAFILFVVGAFLYIKLSKEVLLRRLKAQQRVVDWKEVEDHLIAGEGTLIIELTNQIGVRFWWTLDDLTTARPEPFLTWEQLGYAYITGKSANPFVSSCFDRYLSVKSGKAFFTRFDTTRLPPGPVESDFFLNLYPQARIVHTLLIRLSG